MDYIRDSVIESTRHPRPSHFLKPEASHSSRFNLIFPRPPQKVRKTQMVKVHAMGWTSLILALIGGPRKAQISSRDSSVGRAID
jgi:hypothetical protein